MEALTSELAGPTIKVVGSSVFCVWPSIAALEFSRIVDKKESLTAEVSVIETSKGLIHWARINLLTTQGRGGLIRACEEASSNGRWRTIIEESCRLVRHHVRTGPPAELLVPEQATASRYLVDQVIPARAITVLFGDGGAGKSLFALSLVVAGLLGFPLSPRWRVDDIRRALYLDWESDAVDHRQRLWSLTRHREMIKDDAILYHRLARPLVEELEIVQGHVARHQADLVICDSLGAACGPEPETGDAAIRTLMALRSLGTTVLVVAHVSKASADQRAIARPFGSVYVQNLARSVIELRRDETPDETQALQISMYHRKANSGPLAKPSGLRFSWNPDGSMSIRETKPDFTRTSLSSQIIEELREGAQTVAVLAENLGSSEGSIRTALHRMENRSTKPLQSVAGGGRGNKTLWGLIDRKRSSMSC